MFSISSAEDKVTRQAKRRDLLENMSEKETVDFYAGTHGESMYVGCFIDQRVYMYGESMHVG